MAKQDDYTRYTIRVPGPLYERVARAAEASQRSVNAEIVAALEERYPPPRPPGPQTAAALAEMLGLDVSDFTEAEMQDVLEAFYEAVRGGKRHP